MNNNNQTTVSIVGLGYVGLPLALLASSKYIINGIDIFENKIKQLKEGRSYIDDITDEYLSSRQLNYTTNFEVVRDSNIVIVCVPTPVSSEKQPDLSPVKDSIKSIAPYLQKGTLIIIESTINPGVCNEIIIPLLETKTKFTVGKDIHIAHCPERINPGDRKWNVSNINRVVGSNSEEGLRRAFEFYSSIINAEIKMMNTLKEAEAVKIVENSFRDINIAFVNELAMSFHALDINLENVIAGAATKPFAFMPHHPSIGVGGHCIPVDPYYLIEYASTYGFQHKFLSLARQINEGMPRFTFTLLRENLETLGTDDNKVGILGLSYKPNVADLRESPSVKLIDILQQTDYEVDVYDPYFSDRSNKKSIDELIADNKVVILATNHKEFMDQITPQKLADQGVSIFIDGRNAFYEQREEFVKLGILYSGIGT